MKATELRIGNLVIYVGICNSRFNKIGEFEIQPYHFGYLFELEDALDLLEPIPLTEEWLLKFGFEKLCSTEKGFKQNVYSMRNPSLQIYELSKGYGVSFWIGNELKYVHQLQNLYFALTNEELTFKSE